MLEKEQTKFEKTVIVGSITGNQTEEKLNEYLDELEFLTTKAGGEVVNRFSQKLENPKPKTLLVTGKIDDVAYYVQDNDISTVLSDDELSPSQQKNLNQILGVKVLDR